MDSHADSRSWASDELIGIAEIRRIFRLGRTAAYELTHRPDFPEPVAISPRCYRWWASEVLAFTATLRQGAVRPSRRKTPKPTSAQAAVIPLQITGRIRAARGSGEPS